MSKLPRTKKKSAATPPAVSRIPDVVNVRDLFKIARQMGMSAEQFERLSGASTSKLRRGRGGEDMVPTPLLEGFRRCETIFVRAVALCGGNEEAAVNWVSAYAPALNGRKPIEAAETVNGCKTVEKLLAQLEAAIGGGGAAGKS